MLTEEQIKFIVDYVKVNCKGMPIGMALRKLVDDKPEYRGESLNSLRRYYFLHLDKTKADVEVKFDRVERTRIKVPVKRGIVSRIKSWVKDLLS